MYGWRSIVCSALAIALIAAAGCSSPDTPVDNLPTVQSYFFPLSNGLIYTYSRFDALKNENDTLVCRLRIGPTKLDPDFFTNTATGDTFYFIGFSKDAGNDVAFMKHGDTTLNVLEGKLEQGATWVADEVHSIHATIIEHYDDYYLPERQIHYPDVLLIKYQQLGNDNNYTLCFFARDRGLIREVSLIGGSTEISSLQLLAIDAPH